MKFLSRFTSSLPIISLGFVFLYLFGPHQDEGNIALIDFFLGLPLAFGIFAYVVAYYARASFKGKKASPFPLITTIALALIFGGMKYSYNIPDEDIFIKADDMRNSIVLSKHGKFEIGIREIEAHFTHRGTYILKKDTIVFERDVSTLTSGRIENKYIIDYLNAALKPVHKDTNRKGFSDVLPIVVFDRSK